MTPFVRLTGSAFTRDKKALSSETSGREENFLCMGHVLIHRYNKRGT